MAAASRRGGSAAVAVRQAGACRPRRPVDRGQDAERAVVGTAAAAGARRGRGRRGRQPADPGRSRTRSQSAAPRYPRTPSPTARGHDPQSVRAVAAGRRPRAAHPALARLQHLRSRADHPGGARPGGRLADAAPPGGSRLPGSARRCSRSAPPCTSAIRCTSRPRRSGTTSGSPRCCRTPGWSGSRGSTASACLPGSAEIGLIPAALLAGLAVDWLRRQRRRARTRSPSSRSPCWRPGCPRRRAKEACRPRSPTSTARSRPTRHGRSWSTCRSGSAAGSACKGAAFAPECEVIATADGHPLAVATLSRIPPATASGIHASRSTPIS